MNLPKKTITQNPVTIFNIYNLLLLFHGSYSMNSHAANGRAMPRTIAAIIFQTRQLAESVRFSAN